MAAWEEAPIVEKTGQSPAWADAPIVSDEEEDEEQSPSFLLKAGRVAGEVHRRLPVTLAPTPEKIEAAARGALSTVGLGVPTDVAGRAVGERIGQGVALATGGRPAPTTPLDESVAMSRARGEELRSEYPLTSFVGAAGTGVGAIRSIGSRLSGGLLTRTLGGAAVAGTEGALYAASEKGDDIAGDAAWSAILGGGISFAGPAVVRKVREVGGGALRRWFSDAGAARLALERLGMKADDIDRAIVEFEGQSKRKPSILDVSDVEGAVEAQRIAQRSSEAQRTIEDAAERKGQAVQESLPGAVLDRRPVVTPGQLIRARDAEFEAAFNPIRQNTIDYRGLTGTQRQNLMNAAEVISEPLAGASNLRTTVRAQQGLIDAEDAFEEASFKLQRAINSGKEKKIDAATRAFEKAEARLVNADAFAKENPITMDNIDSARFDLAAAYRPTVEGGKKGQKTLDAAAIRRAVTEVGTNLYPEYGTALRTYGARSQRAAAAFGAPKSGEAGTVLPSGLARRVVAGGGDPDSLIDGILHAAPPAKQGTAIGTMQLMARAAQKSPEDAAKLVANISKNRAMQRALTQAVGKREAKRVIDLAKLEHAANVNFKIATGGARKAGSDIAAQDASEALRAIYSTKLGGAALANLAKDIGDTFLVPPNVARKFAQNISDPNRAEETLKAMRRIAKNDEAVVEMLKRNAVVASAVSGYAVGQTDSE